MIWKYLVNSKPRKYKYKEYNITITDVLFLSKI